MEYIIPLLLMAAFVTGANLGALTVSGEVESNTVDGYHCAPIVKVSTMEEAKKQIEINQAMTGVKG
tara:strand:+ start:880 stop:1077 length:198 start_codon:yes stop_codon:yes gene_type:complete